MQCPNRWRGGISHNFVSGSVSHVGVTETVKPVVILRDTGAAQTVVLNNVLPLCDDTNMHTSVLFECIGDTGYQPLP